MRKKITTTLCTLMLLALGLILFYEKKEETPANSASIRHSAKPGMQRRSVTHPATPIKHDSIANRPVNAPVQKDVSAGETRSGRPALSDTPVFSESINQIDAELKLVSLTDAADLRRLLKVARQIEEKQLVHFITAKLSDTDLSLQERGNVVWLATKLNSKEMTSVWLGLLTRSLPAFATESADWSKWMLDHRNENLRLMQAEQLRALSGLGALQTETESSRDFIYRFVLNEVVVPGDLTLLRFEAARQMQQHSKTSLLRLAKVLDGNDPLRRQLSLYADSKRGQKK